MLIASGVFVVLSAIAFSACADFFLRMHPPALATRSEAGPLTLAGTSILLARESPMLHPLLIIVMLSITVP